MKIIITIITLSAFFALEDSTYARSTQKSNWSDTTKSDQHLQSGLKKLREKKYAEAVTDFTKAIGENKKNWRAFRFRGDAEAGLDDYKFSISDYTTALQLNPSDTLSYAGRAEAKRISGDIEGAIKDYNVVLPNTKDSFLWFGRALCFFHSEQYKNAILDLDVFLKKGTSKRDIKLAYRLRGQSFFNEGQYGNSLIDLDTYMKLGGKKEDDIVMHGVSYYFLRKQNPQYLDSALADLKIGVTLYPKDAVTQYYLGQVYIGKHDLKSAEVNFEKAVSLDPKNRDALFSLITVKSFKAEYQNEYDLFQKYLKLKNELDNGQEFYFLGLAKWGAKRDTVGVVQDFEKASELGDVDRVMLFNRWVELLFGSAKYTTTLKKRLTEEIAHTTDSLKTGYLYASLSLVNAQENNSSETKSDIEKTIKFAPKSPIIYLVKGALGKALNLTNETVLENYDKAIALNNKLPEAYLMKAYFYRHQGDQKKSCENLTKAEELGAKPTESLKEYLCKGTNLTSSKESELNFVIYPYLRDAMIKFK